MLNSLVEASDKWTLGPCAGLKVEMVIRDVTWEVGVELHVLG